MIFSTLILILNILKIIVNKSSWSYALYLEEGEDDIVVKAVDMQGNEAILSLGTIIAFSYDDYLNSLSVPESKPQYEIPTQENYYVLYQDNYLSYGYWVNENNDIEDFWINGIVTPQDFIQDNIQNQVTASYSGNTIAYTQEGLAQGNINFNFNFGDLSLNGNLNFQTQNGPKWDVEFDGSLTPGGFNTDHIITGNDSVVKNIDGTLNGNFYGNEAQSVGGTFVLTSDNGDAKGAFVAIKKE